MGERDDLGSYRARIDRIDRDILELLNKRAREVLEVHRIKRLDGLPYYDPQREEELVAALCTLNQGPLDDRSVASVFRQIVSVCRFLGMPPRVLFLGPEASFCHMAARIFFGPSSRFMPAESIPEIFKALDSGRERYGVVPIENTLEGSVNLTLDQLVRSRMKIEGEVLLPVSQMLMSKKSGLEGIERVLSHSHALSQCRQWLVRHLPGRQWIETSSTAEAARQASSDPSAAAIGSRLAAETYRLNILAEGLEENPSNITRFLILGDDPCKPTGADKTSILFSTANRPGALYRALRPFAKRGLNLIKIESRPSKGEPWEYIFFLDFEGHIEEEGVKECLESLRKYTIFLRVLGSYPKGEIVQAVD